MRSMTYGETIVRPLLEIPPSPRIFKAVLPRMSHNPDCRLFSV